jgi:C4-dicarboxylate transporter DctM subunit
LCKPARDLPEAWLAFDMNIFVAQSVLGLELESIYWGIIPFLLIYLLALILITYVPVISLGGMRLLLGVN